MTRRVTSRALPALLAVGGLLVAGVLALLVVTKGDLVERDDQATTYLVTGRADVPRGLVQDDVVVLSGTVTVRGTVEDDVYVVDGRVRIAGTVHGDVTVLRGNVRVDAGGQVGGHIAASGTVRVAEGAEVGGDIRSTSALPAVRSLPRSLWFALWLAAGLAVLGVGLALPRPAADAAKAGLARPPRAVVLGGVTLVVIPLVAGVLAVSLLGLGVALVLGAALVVGGTLGAASAGVAVGRLVGLPTGPSSFLAGWAALGAALALALLLSPLLAALGGALVLAFGLGALAPSRDHRDSPDDQEDDREPSRPAPTVVDDGEPMILAAFPIEAAARN